MKIVLLAEDSAEDIATMKFACDSTRIRHKLQVVTGGGMAIDYLSGQGPYAKRLDYPMPDIVFLDVRMPQPDGYEVLAWIREQPGFKKLPVVMLSGYSTKEDVDRAYKLGATSYLRKLPEMVEFAPAVAVILQYWLNLNIGAA